MPSELPKFGTPRRATPVFVPRQSIFSSSVMSESRLSILFSIGRAGFLKGCADCCAVAGARASARRLNMLESRFINIDSLPFLLISADRCMQKPNITVSWWTEVARDRQHLSKPVIDGLVRDRGLSVDSRSANQRDVPRSSPLRYILTGQRCGH